MTTTKPVTVFVCGPALSGEVLSDLLVRDGAVVWEGRADPAPLPLEPIRAVHHVPVEGYDRLVLVVTDVALYLASIDDLIKRSSTAADTALTASESGIIPIA